MKICYSVLHGCPCGYLSDSKHQCRCSFQQIHRYRTRISGPLLDRIDIHVDVPAVPYKDLAAIRDAESSAAIRKRVGDARAVQADRFKRFKLHCNAQMGSRHIKRFCRIGDDSQRLLETAIDKLGLSARAYSRILKIARSIADLAGGGAIAVEHVSEAIQYRSLDRGRIRPGGIF